MKDFQTNNQTIQEIAEKEGDLTHEDIENFALALAENVAAMTLVPNKTPEQEQALDAFYKSLDRGQ
ncbi:MAG TPA: hypothetical protein VHL10_00730 [Nitrososphaera sp.]|jgi:hypothetical protein|nr:hypothetical protein [Nitrososphaera sp.]